MANLVDETIKYHRVEETGVVYQIGERVMCATRNGKGYPEVNLRRGTIVGFRRVDMRRGGQARIKVLVKFDVGHTRWTRGIETVAVLPAF